MKAICLTEINKKIKNRLHQEWGKNLYTNII